MSARGSVWPKAPIFRCRGLAKTRTSRVAPAGAAAPSNRRDRPSSIVRPDGDVGQAAAPPRRPETDAAIAAAPNRIKRKGIGAVVSRRHRRVALTDRASMDKDERQRGSVWPKAPIFRCRGLAKTRTSRGRPPAPPHTVAGIARAPSFAPMATSARPQRRPGGPRPTRRSPRPRTELSEKELAQVAGQQASPAGRADRPRVNG